ncbi:MAG: hypothetical protein GEV10_20490 [Streptosporangiales bacterium]|nr:hypothetical protein [Streptosporangiales bacterium]
MSVTSDRLPRAAPPYPYLLAVPLVVVLLLVTATPGHAAPTPGAGDDERRAVDLLTRAMTVAGRTAYQGVQELRMWSGGELTAATVRVRNVPGRGTFVTDTRGRRTVSAAVAAQGRTTGPQLGLLTANFRIARSGAATVAGRVADVVDARLGADRLMARYWLDRATGLMLRREAFGDDGSLARRSVFTRVAIGATSGASAPAAAPPVDLGRRVPVPDVGRLHAGGWTVPRDLGDLLTLYDVRRTEYGGSEALHLSYSDGISAVSVFEQRGHLDESHLDGWHHARVGGRTVYVRDTVPRQLMWAGPETVFTVVADAPDTAVDDAVRALPREQARPGFWTRMARGFGRIVSWCNPF